MRPRRRNYWAVEADKILAPLFAEGQEPTWVELRDAYPFGERKYWPYKVWPDAIYRWQNPTVPPHRRRPLGSANACQTCPVMQNLRFVFDVFLACFNVFVRCSCNSSDTNDGGQITHVMCFLQIHTYESVG